MTGDVLVYLHPNDTDYVALFDEHGWQQWPAVQDGWLTKRGCSATLAERCEELSPKLADLAIRLSGVTL